MKRRVWADGWCTESEMWRFVTLSWPSIRLLVFVFFFTFLCPRTTRQSFDAFKMKLSIVDLKKIVMWSRRSLLLPPFSVGVCWWLMNANDFQGIFTCRCLFVSKFFCSLQNLDFQACTTWRSILKIVFPTTMLWRCTFDAPLFDFCVRAIPVLVDEKYFLIASDSI